jgi:selenocysteine lyase/cysteine desulfurase
VLFVVKIGCTYLDHAGAGQYSRCQIDAVTALLMHSVLGNPHTTGGISEVTSYRVQKAREDVLKFFNTSEADYTVVFTVLLHRCHFIVVINHVECSVW